MKPSERITVVITTYNRSDALLAVLRGLVNQTDQNFEVVVADDGSGESDRDKIFESTVVNSLNLLHVWHPDIGFTAARIRNRGVAASGSGYIVFMDGDCVPEIDFIARHKALAQESHFVNGSRVLLSPDLSLRIIAGQEVVSNRSIGFWVRQRYRGHANKLTHLLRLPDRFRRVQSSFSWKGIRSCNLGVWKTDFAMVDGFDESFVGWGHEDADFVLRLHSAGVRRKNGFCATEVFHLWHPEAARTRESCNFQLVLKRMDTKIIRATLGCSQHRDNDDVVITRLGKLTHD